MNPLNAACLLSELVDDVSDEGVTLSIESDPATLYAMESSLPDKSLSKLFNPSYVDLVPDRFFWIRGSSHNGDIVHVQACKLEDTGRSTLGDYLNMHLNRTYPSTQKNWHRCEALERIGGRCAYQGDNWLAESFRGNGVGTKLTQIGLLSCFLRWQPDFVYAFFEHPVFSKGLGCKFGYQNFEPVGQHFVRWLLPHDYVSWMSWKNMVTLIEMTAPRTGLEALQR